MCAHFYVHECNSISNAVFFCHILRKGFIYVVDNTRLYQILFIPVCAKDANMSG